ncbi:MAG: thioredoxin family protein [Patescibacteria group bacterium]|nr:thioredoxin family protein [Patescibacteria group bacterium]
MKKTQKGVSKILLLLVIVVILVISAIIFGYGGQEVQNVKNDMQDKAQDVVDERGEKAVEKVVESGREAVGEKLKETGEKLLEEKVVAGFYGNYADINQEDFERTILFFTAPWCPNCTETGNNIEAEQKEIPDNVAVVRVDFDNESELREKYHVEKQHTFVLVDKNGKEISRWNNSTTVEEIIDNIK